MVGIWGWGSGNNNATAASAPLPSAPTPGPGQVQVNQCQGKKDQATTHCHIYVPASFLCSLTSTLLGDFLSHLLTILLAPSPSFHFSPHGHRCVPALFSLISMCMCVLAPEAMKDQEKTYCHDM